MSGLSTTGVPDGAAHETITGHALLAAFLDELERHRSTDVEERLIAARHVERQAQETGAVVAAMRAKLVSADMLQRTGRVAEGADLAVEVNSWAAVHGPRSLLARSHLVLSSVFESIGDVASGLQHALRAKDLLEEDDAKPRERGNYLLRLADALALNGFVGDARARYREAEDLFVGLGDSERHLTVLNNLAMLEYEIGDVKRALNAVRQLRDISGTVGLDASLADTIGRVLLAAGDHDAAESVLLEGYRLLGERGSGQAVTPAELALTHAEVLLAQGRLEAAHDELDRCLAVCLDRRLEGVRVQALRVRAEILAARGLFEDAYRAHRFFHNEYVTLRSKQREAASRTRQSLFETAEARRAALQFWEQARTDPLTEVYNRRYVDEELPKALAAVATGGGTLVLALVDADHFKQVNDRFSHAVGDQVLRRLASVIAAAVPVRPGAGPDDAPLGFAARLGGEEFLLVQCVDTAQEGFERVEAVRRAVQEQDWSDIDPDLTVTVSAGATEAQPTDTQTSLVSRADTFLYRAKTEGRNRTVTDLSPPTRPVVTEEPRPTGPLAGLIGGPLPPRPDGDSDLPRRRTSRDR